MSTHPIVEPGPRMPSQPLKENGGQVIAPDVLIAALEAVEQPVWVVDASGLIRFANRAAVVALGYSDAGQLLGRNSHETIHHHHPGGRPFAAAECPMLRPRTTGETVASDLDWFFRRDGSMFRVSYVSAPLEMTDGRGAVVAFTDIDARSRAEQALRDREARLADEQAALRRVGTLVARGASRDEVFTAIARECAGLFGTADVGTVDTGMVRYEDDSSQFVVASSGKFKEAFSHGSRKPLGGENIASRVFRTGRAVRIDDYAIATGPIGEAARSIGLRSAVGTPIEVEGRLWGAMITGTAEDEPLPPDTEARLGQFTDMMATAIANTESRARANRLTEEQAALRRVATLVAHGAAPADVFDAVAAEMERVLNADGVTVSRYEPDSEVTVLAHRGVDARKVRPGSRWNHEGENETSIVRRTERPARMQAYRGTHGPIAELVEVLGVQATVAAPIVVEGRLWGVIIAYWRGDEPPPAGTEERMSQFAQLLETAVANADSRDQLTASRARLVTEADDARRRVVRDLHDGAQQRLVHAIITLKLALRAMRANDEEA